MVEKSYQRYWNNMPIKRGSVGIWKMLEFDRLEKTAILYAKEVENFIGQDISNIPYKPVKKMSMNYMEFLEYKWH